MLGAGKEEREHHMTRFRFASLLVAILTGACSAASPPNTAGNLPAAPAAIPDPPAAEMETRVDGLSAAFLAYVYPIDGDDLALGWRTFEVPLFRDNMRALGSCIEAEGFRQVATAFREAMPGMPVEAWQFPNLVTLRALGFNTPPADVALDLTGSMEPEAAITDSEHPLVQTLALHPELGVAPTIEAAVELNDVLWSCVVANQMTEAFDHVYGLKASWRSELHRLDETPALAAVIAGFVECVRIIDPVFADVADVWEWWSVEFGQRINLDFDPDVTEEEFAAELVRWGQAYADCVLPVTEAREEARLAARQKHVDEQLVQLLETQADLMVDLAP